MFSFISVIRPCNCGGDLLEYEKQLPEVEIMPGLKGIGSITVFICSACGDKWQDKPTS